MGGNNNLSSNGKIHQGNAGKIVGQSKTNFHNPLLGPKTSPWDPEVIKCVYYIKCNVDPKIVFDNFLAIYEALDKQAQNEIVASRLYKHEIIEIYEDYKKVD